MSIQRILEAVEEHRELQPLVEALLEEAQNTLSAAGAAIYLVEGSEGQLRLLGKRGVTPEGQEWARRLAFAVADREGLIALMAGGQPTSAIALPMRARGALVGVLAFAFEAPKALSPTELETARTVASIAGTAIGGALSSNSESRLREQIDLLIRASVAVSDRLAMLPEPHLRAVVQRGFHLWPYVRDKGIPDFLRSVLEAIAEHARAAAGAEYAALGIGDDPTRPFAPWVFAGLPKEKEAALGPHPRPVGTLGLVAREGKVVRTRDVRRHPSYSGIPPGHPEIRSMLGVPIRYRGLNLGNLYLANKLGSEEFTPEDQRSVEMLAAHAALVFQQVYLRAMIDAQRAQLQIILDSAPSGILFIEAVTGHVMANPRAMQLFGRPLVPESGQAQLLSQVFHADGRPLSPMEARDVAATLGAEPIASKECLIVQPGGRRIPVLLSSSPVRGFGDEVIGVVIVLDDLSALKELQALRAEVAALVAHDLRNPIQTILLQSRKLLSDAGEKRAQTPIEAIRRIEGSALRLSQMVSDLMEVAQLELGQLPLKREPLSCKAALSALIERIRPSLGHHPVELSVEEPLPQIFADPRRFEQVLTNLLENAAKYSPEPRPIRVRLTPEAKGVRVSVTDEGAGIPPDELPRLFERSWRSAEAREARLGHGLGLYIVKGLVEAHGGRVWAESAAGRGSTFHLWFPPYRAP